MSDPNEIRALKASLGGAIDTAAALAALQPAVAARDERGDITPEVLDDLARVSTAHAVASSALRGLINTMLTRRSAPTG